MGGPEAVSKPGAEYGVGERDLRISDAEREHVGRLLQRAVGLGMLSLGEFTERMDTALAAKTRGELNAVLIDLPGIQLVGQPAPTQRFVKPPHVPVPHPAAMIPASAGNVIRSRMSNTTRKGPWNVPATLLLDNIFAGVTLDFTQAIMSTQVVEIRMNDSFSSLTLIVPAEATVDLNGLELLGSSVNNKVRTGPPIGPLHLVVHGRIRFGSVTAKHPFAAQWKKFMQGM